MLSRKKQLDACKFISKDNWREFVIGIRPQKEQGEPLKRFITKVYDEKLMDPVK